MNPAVLAAFLALAVAPAVLPDPSPALQTRRATPQTDRVESLAIVVHRSNPVDGLTLRELRRIFLLDVQTWQNGRRITVVLREKGQAQRARALRLICGMSEAEFDRHILLQTFRGNIGLGPRSILSSSAMLRFVFNAPGAIGYVPADEVDQSVKTLRIDQLLPSDPDYPLARRSRATEAVGASR